jgi:hypothetical protein
MTQSDDSSRYEQVGICHVGELIVLSIDLITFQGALGSDAGSSSIKMPGLQCKLIMTAQE